LIFADVVLIRENQWESEDLWWMERQGRSLAQASGSFGDF